MERNPDERKPEERMCPCLPPACPACCTAPLLNPHISALPLPALCMMAFDCDLMELYTATFATIIAALVTASPLDTATLTTLITSFCK